MIRTPTPRDQSYIASTWTRSLLSQHAADRDPAMRSHAQISALVDATLDRKDTRAAIRYVPGDRDAILGWVLYAEGYGAPVVHYTYTRRSGADGLLRGNGIATELLAHIGVRHDAGVVCTSLGPCSRDMRARYRSAEYLPLKEFLMPGGKK